MNIVVETFDILLLVSFKRLGSLEVRASVLGDAAARQQ